MGEVGAAAGSGMAAVAALESSIEALGLPKEAMALGSRVPDLAVTILIAMLLALSALSTFLAYRQRRINRRLADLERAKSQLLKIASHELRTPLTVIRGYIGLAADGSLGRLSPEMKRSLPALRAKAEQLDQTVEKMLVAAKLDVGRMEAKHVTCYPADLARLAVAEVGRRFPDRTVSLASDGDPAAVVTDPELVTIVLGNLIENALKYSDPAALVEVVAGRRGSRVGIEVLDRGVGIADEDRDKLFTRFGRIDTDHNTPIPGAGLGLYLADRLSAPAQAEVRYWPREGGGSVFRVDFSVVRRLTLRGPDASVQPRPAGQELLPGGGVIAAD